MIFYLGAWAVVDGKNTKLFNSRLWHGPVEAGVEVSLDGASRSGLVTRDGLMIPGTDGRWCVVRLLSVEGKFVKVSILRLIYKNRMVQNYSK